MDKTKKKNHLGKGGMGRGDFFRDKYTGEKYQIQLKCRVDCSGSSILILSLGIKGLLVPDSLLAESLCCVLEQGTLSAA